MTTVLGFCLGIRTFSQMTAVSGASLRTTEAYWELSGPLPVLTNTSTCRACKKSIGKGKMAMCRDGRKLRFFYHVECFTGEADPRTQQGGAFMDGGHEYHTKTAPKVSSLEGPRAARDSDGRLLGREVFKQSPPKVLGIGKWSVAQRGYNPNLEAMGSIGSSSPFAPSTSKIKTSTDSK